MLFGTRQVGVNIRSFLVSTGTSGGRSSSVVTMCRDQETKEPL